MKDGIKLLSLTVFSVAEQNSVLHLIYCGNAALC